MPADVEAINGDFGLDGLRFEGGPGGLARGLVSTPACTAEFYLHGAQVTRWRPTGGEDVLWLSPSAVYQDGRAIRGGIPICFPWFGPHPSDPGAPSHGFARTREWALVAAELRGDAVEVRLEALLDHWACRLTVAFGHDLRVTLDVRNEADAPASFEAALHTYLAVSDVEAVSVEGLEHQSFIDQVGGGVERGAAGVPLTFRGEVDRVYLGGGDTPVVVRDAERTITVAAEGARSTVVWNPGADRARALADLGEVEWRHMVCVETANVRSDAVSLDPGARGSLTATLRVGVT